MAKKNKTPLRSIAPDDIAGPNLENLDIDKAMDLSPSELEALGLDPTKLFDIQQKATFATDQALGVGAGALTGKKVDNSAIDEYLAKIETPTGSDVYSKQAAMYRSQGEGAVLRTQKNLSNLLLPTLDLIQKREAAAMARFTLLKNRMPEFDDTTIFGDQSGNPMPISDEIKNISAQTKEDLRMLSRLNPMDERYDEIKKRVEENQSAIVNFDAVNKQLLEIRNAGTDESQWSQGMDETTANMWRDIYTSNGKNIKIQDGKLVWTDEKGTTRYKFDDVSDKGPKREALGYSSDGNTDNDSDLGTLHWLTMEGNNQGTRSDLSIYDETTIERIQTSLNNLGFTDDNGNKLEVDGDFGDKTEEAYKKYLAQKDELEQAYFDKNLSEEDKQKYGVTTGVGETRVIDLSQIGDGPTMINSAAVNQDILIRGNAQELINQGVGVDDPMYNTLIKQQIFQLNSIGPDGIKSLIFDGLRNDADSIYNGINTDSFMEQVIKNHYGEDLSESEIAEKIELMRAGDVTQMYNNGKGGQDTLQSQFMEWYKKEIDTQIEEGKKSKVVPGGPPPPPPPPNYYTGKNLPAVEMASLKNTYLQDGSVNYEYGVRGAQMWTKNNKTKGGIPLEVGEIGIDKASLEKIFKNSSNNDVSDYDFGLVGDDFKLGTDNMIYQWNDANKIWEKTRFNANSDEGISVSAWNVIIKELNKGTDLNIKTVGEFKNVTRREYHESRHKAQWPSAYGYGFDFDKIKKKNQSYHANSAIDKKVKHGDSILEWHNDDYVAGTLNREYGKLGFEFRDSGSDEITVCNTYGGTQHECLTFDSNTTDDADKLIKWMKKMYNNHVKWDFEEDHNRIQAHQVNGVWKSGKPASKYED